MRTTGLMLVAWSLMLVGCMPRIIDRDELAQRYKETALNPAVLSSVPLQIDPDQPPTVVNWWYAGTRKQRHYIVFRELTWDSRGRPVGQEKWYRVPAGELSTRVNFDKTYDDAQWLPLYEAAVGLAPPADLPTARLRPEPVSPDPIKPRGVQPRDDAPRPITPPEQGNGPRP